MKRSLQILLYVMMLAGMSAIPHSQGHHGWSNYQEEFRLTLVVTELKLRNPHDRLIGRDKEGRIWNLLLAPPARNRRFGFDESVIQVDQEIRIFGQKHPKKLEVKVHCIYKGDTLVYTYRYPYGSSSLKRLGNQQEC